MPREISPSQLVGWWRLSSGGYVCDWLIRGDGSYSAEVTKASVTISRQAGKWRLEGDVLVTFSITDEFDAIGRTEDRDTLLDVDEDYFVLRNRAGIRHRYERIQALCE